jgi:hypothetical protein
MTSHRSDGLPVDNGRVLADFLAEVYRLMSLSHDEFAELDADALPSLLATIRATSGGVSGS